MDQFEATTHPFIVRIWLEETAAEAGQASWRGYIVHVPSGERRYIHDLGEIPAFIAPYMEAMGVHLADRGSRGRPPAGSRPRSSLVKNLRHLVQSLIHTQNGTEQG
jgi:hypothetical protein